VQIDFRQGQGHDQQVRDAQRRLEAVAHLRRQIDHDALVNLALAADPLAPRGLARRVPERQRDQAQAVRRPLAQPCRGRALRVGVDQPDRALPLGQAAGEVHGYRALARAALEVADGDDLAHQDAFPTWRGSAAWFQGLVKIALSPLRGATRD
jgi:hypothetical protein